MKPEFELLQLTVNEVNKRFELEVDGHLAFINFGQMGSQIALVHTEADPELSGTGAASALVEKTLQWTADQNLTVLPFCPFVFAFIKKHPEWKKVVDPRFKAYDKL